MKSQNEKYPHSTTYFIFAQVVGLLIIASLVTGIAMLWTKNWNWIVFVLTVTLSLAISIKGILSFYRMKQNEKSLVNQHSSSSHSSLYSLNSKSSISNAISNLDILIKNNSKNAAFYKSYLSLPYSKEELWRSIYFLKDCIQFSDDEMIFKNERLQEAIAFQEVVLLEYYLDIDPSRIPNEKRENFKFGKQINSARNINEEQISHLKLINWRSKEQWAFWAKKHTLNNPLGQYCQLQTQA